jgi:hypothetical protein
MRSLVLLGYIRLVKYKLCVWLHWDIPPDQKINTTREVHTHLILGYIHRERRTTYFGVSGYAVKLICE